LVAGRLCEAGGYTAGVYARGRRHRRSGLARLGKGWRFAVIMVAALAVLAADGWWLLRTRESATQITPPTMLADAVSQAAVLDSAQANFSTQVAGITTVFGQVSEQLKPNRATLTMTTVDGADRFGVSEVVTGSAVYLRAPGLASGVGKPWVSEPLTGLSTDPAMIGLYQTEAIPSADAALLGTAASVRSAGTGVIDGDRTTRYVGTIKPATALRRLPPAVRQLLAPELRTVTGDIRFVAWIDALHNLRKVQTTETMAGSSTVTTVVVKALNPLVHITVPDSSLVSAFTAAS
jgi:hypothetical protein